jgi:hypothetical protein
MSVIWPYKLPGNLKHVQIKRILEVLSIRRPQAIPLLRARRLATASLSACFIVVESRVRKGAAREAIAI